MGSSLPKSKTINFGFWLAIVEKRSILAGSNTENQTNDFNSDGDI